MFEQACNERIQQFDDNDSDEDIWEEKEITFSPNAQQQNRAAYVKAYQFMRHNSWLFINTFEALVWKCLCIRLSTKSFVLLYSSRLPETRDESDSTDSEEELDSPRKIVSQPNEKMDVDNAESR